jgi:hypothetical protein
VSSAKSDGSERRKIDAQPVIQLETVSPDGRWAVAQVAIQNEDVPRGILAIPLEGGTPIRICSGLCVVRWPRDGKSMFLSVIGEARGTCWERIHCRSLPVRCFPNCRRWGWRQRRMRRRCQEQNPWTILYCQERTKRFMRSAGPWCIATSLGFRFPEGENVVDQAAGWCTRQEWLAEMAAASRFAEARSTLPNTSRRELKL